MLSSSISADPTIPVTKPFDGIDSASTSSADKSAEKPIDNGGTPPSQSPPSSSPKIEEVEHNKKADPERFANSAEEPRDPGKEELKKETSSKTGWESPVQEPVNGVVQPRTVPPTGKPTRQTNQLDYIAKEILKPALKHKHAWPFLRPVDAVKLNIPDYHKVIKRPMDLGTIEKRLKNCYYTCAEECVNDIMTMFNNCFTYCPPTYGVYAMAKKLESDILAKLSRMPANDFEQMFANCYRFNQNEDDVALMCKNIENIMRDKLKHMPSQEVEVPKQVPKKAGKVAKKTVAQRGASVASNVGRGSVASSPHSSAPSETAAAVLEYFHNATIQVSRESSSVRDGELTEKKAPKRKAESPLVFDEKPVRRDNPNSRYEALKTMDYTNLKPRYTGKLSSQMKFCSKVINELVTSKKCKEFNWPFLEPVNDVELNIPDYYVVIKKPMDLGTIKRKFDARQYATPEEIRDDVHLVCNNCFQYNPEGQTVNKMGKDLMKYFDERWKNLPQEVEPLPEVPLTPITSTAAMRDPYAFPGARTTPAPLLPAQSTPITHNQTYGPLATDDAIDTLLEDVQSEQFRLTSRVAELQRYMQELIQLKQRRREAREQKAVAPSLSGELHTHIKKSLMSGGIAGLITPFSAVGTQPTFTATPIAQNPPPALLSPVAASANMFSAAANGAKRRAGRPKGSGNLPKTPSVDMATLPLASPVTQPPVLPPAPPTLSQQAFNAAPTDNSMPPPGQAPLAKSGRGRKPGSKNKPKGAREEKPEYEFNSDEDQASEPMTYEEKKRLSTNINNLPSDRLSKVLQIIAKREKLDPEFNPEEVEIDFETLQPKTLRELEIFVTQCGQKSTRRQNAPRPLEQAARKRELEQRLAEIGGNSKRGMSGAPPRGRPPANMTSANRDSSESSSSSSSSSSESSSSDSSDSESEQKEAPKTSPRPNGTNNLNRPRANPSVTKPTNNNTLNSAPGVNGVKPEDKRNIVHSGAGPLLQNNNAVSHAGISGSVLDQLLPAAEASADNNTGLSKGNYLDSFDTFKRMKREKDMTKQTLAQRDQERSKNGMESTSTSRQDEIQRLKMAEKERRQREAANDEGITTQMDIMANFEDNF